MPRSRVQRFFAVLLGVYMLAMVVFYGVAVFCYNPLAESMRQADVEWERVQRDCMTISENLSKLPAVTDSKVLAAQKAFDDTPIKPNQPPPNPKDFAVCQKVQDDLIAAVQEHSATTVQANGSLQLISEKLADIPKARVAYNEKATAYNQRVHTFPNIIITIPFCFLEKPKFTTHLAP